MAVVWIISTFSAGIVAACVIMHREDLRAAPRGWQLLATSGVPLALAGLGFIVQFWDPLPGPYRANEVYPLGPYLNAWAVSFGFMWLAFGVLFFAHALRAQHTWRTWLTLFVAWLVAWIPHGIIGIGFAAAGDNEPSIQLYRNWASEWPGLVRLTVSALIMVGHFTLGILGFVLAGRGLVRARSAGGSA